MWVGVEKIDKLYCNKNGKKVLRHRLYLECGHSVLRLPSVRVGNRVGTKIICLKCKGKENEIRK